MRSWTLELTPVSISRRADAKTMRLPPSQNSGGMGMHWQTRKRWNEGFKVMVKCLLRAQNVRPLAKARVTIVNYCLESQARDRDNLTGCVKPMVDALTEYGIVADDREQYVELVCRNVAVPKMRDKRVTMTIDEMEGPPPVRCACGWPHSIRKCKRCGQVMCRRCHDPRENIHRCASADK